MEAFRYVEDVLERLDELLDVFLEIGGNVTIVSYMPKHMEYSFELADDWSSDDISGIFNIIRKLISVEHSILICLPDSKIYLETYDRIDGTNRIYTLDVI